MKRARVKAVDLEKGRSFVVTENGDIALLRASVVGERVFRQLNVGRRVNVTLDKYSRGLCVTSIKLSRSQTVKALIKDCFR